MNLTKIDDIAWIWATTVAASMFTTDAGGDESEMVRMVAASMFTTDAGGDEREMVRMAGVVEDGEGDGVCCCCCCCCC